MLARYFFSASECPIQFKLETLLFNFPVYVGGCSHNYIWRHSLNDGGKFEQVGCVTITISEIFYLLNIYIYIYWTYIFTSKWLHIFIQTYAPSTLLFQECHRQITSGLFPIPALPIFISQFCFSQRLDLHLS